MRRRPSRWRPGTPEGVARASGNGGRRPVGGSRCSKPRTGADDTPQSGPRAAHGIGRKGLPATTPAGRRRVRRRLTVADGDVRWRAMMEKAMNAGGPTRLIGIGLPEEIAFRKEAAGRNCVAERIFP